MVQSSSIRNRRTNKRIIDRTTDEFAFSANSSQPYEEPNYFREAWDHEDPLQRTQWRKAIHKEFRNMNKQGVWRKIKKAKVPSNRRTVKCKWVLKIKRNDIFHARLVACSYSQIAGVDFTENYAPVINDITWRILIAAMIVWKLDAKIVDVETAFLHGDLEEDIYMDCPPGMKNEPDKCLQLGKTVYGLVQAARQWWKKLVTILRKIGFEGGYSDPCLMTRRYALGIIFIALYVDDCLCVGHTTAIKDTIEQLKVNGLEVTVEDKLTDYLSCEINFSKNKKKAWLGQPHLLLNLEKKFGKTVEKLQVYQTPGTPGAGILRPETEEEKTSDEEQSEYRTGVEMLLCLVKHSRPDIANAVRELSKSVDGATCASLKEMRRIIKFVLDTKEWGLKIEPKPEGQDWYIVVFCDSDYAGDKEKRISVTGFIVYLLGVPISWKSKAQRSVTLSSSEAEFVALSKAAKEIKFVVQVMLSMGIPVRIPIIVQVNNVGAIFMAQNVTTSTWTKHVDVRYHFVREFVEEGFIKIIFVGTKDNNADIYTKNTSGEIHDEHTKKLMGTKEHIEENDKTD
jgi:hypothetical protein